MNTPPAIPLDPARPARLPHGAVLPDDPRLRRSGDAVYAVPGPGARRLSPQHEIAPVLLTSSLDPVVRLFVVENRLTRGFVAWLRSLDLAPVVAVPQTDGNDDVWMQDTLEWAVSPAPDGRRVRQTPVPLLGLRARHDAGLVCGPLDDAAARVAAAVPDAVPYRPADPLPGRRWIDWYGNLEVTPPLPGHPFGRVLIGDQRGLTPHPDLLRFLEDQRLQWPPVVGDVSWLTIGHIDEMVAFVPARGGRGWKALFASPARARQILEAEVAAGRGDATAMPGSPQETTARRLLHEVALSPAGRTTEAAAQRGADALAQALGIGPDARIDLPCLFVDGMAVVPNMVNALVVGRTVVASDPLYPPFRAEIRARLEPLGLSVRLRDVREPYHVRGGEIHCATNAQRRLRRPRWWDPAVESTEEM